jgi:hypothetical protein
VRVAQGLIAPEVGSSHFTSVRKGSCKLSPQSAAPSPLLTYLSRIVNGTNGLTALFTSAIGQNAAQVVGNILPEILPTLFISRKITTKAVVLQKGDEASCKTTDPKRA